MAPRTTRRERPQSEHSASRPWDLPGMNRRQTDRASTMGRNKQDQACRVFCLRLKPDNEAIQTCIGNDSWLIAVADRMELVLESS